MKIPAHTLIHYVRDNNGDPRGVIVAVKTNNDVSLGWSYCRKTDRFTKEMALQIAIGRAMQPGLSFCQYRSCAKPHQIAREFDKFVARCNKYYKLKTLKN